MGRNQEWSRPPLSTQLLAHAADLAAVAAGVEALTRVQPNPDVPTELRAVEVRAAESVLLLAREIEGYAERIAERLLESER